MENLVKSNKKVIYFNKLYLNKEIIAHLNVEETNPIKPQENGFIPTLTGLLNHCDLLSSIQTALNL